MIGCLLTRNIITVVPVLVRGLDWMTLVIPSTPENK